MDNATNHTSEVERHHDIVNIPHVVHSINMAVRKGFGVRATETPLRLKVAATHFNKSNTVSNVLKEKQNCWDWFIDSFIHLFTYLQQVQEILKPVKVASVINVLNKY